MDLIIVARACQALVVAEVPAAVKAVVPVSSHFALGFEGHSGIYGSCALPFWSDAVFDPQALVITRWSRRVHIATCDRAMGDDEGERRHGEGTFKVPGTFAFRERYLIQPISEKVGAIVGLGGIIEPWRPVGYLAALAIYLPLSVMSASWAVLKGALGGLWTLGTCLADRPIRGHLAAIHSGDIAVEQAFEGLSRGQCWRLLELAATDAVERRLEGKPLGESQRVLEAGICEYYHDDGSPFLDFLRGRLRRLEFMENDVLYALEKGFSVARDRNA